MIQNNVIVAQSNNRYELSLQVNNQSLVVAYILMPHDGEYMNDYKKLEVITKSIAERWNILEKKGKK